MSGGTSARAVTHDPRELTVLPDFQPTLSGPLLTGWDAKESITFLAPDGQANVIASSEPLDVSIDTAQYARVQAELLRTEFPGYREYSEEDTMIFGERKGVIRRFQWLPPDGVAVTQIQLYYAERGRGYTATATTPSSQFERYEGELRDILEGLTIGTSPELQDTDAVGAPGTETRDVAAEAPINQLPSRSRSRRAP